jgi:hypothetical protein
MAGKRGITVTTVTTATPGHATYVCTRAGACSINIYEDKIYRQYFTVILILHPDIIVF